jgi:hypothetical protein
MIGRDRKSRSARRDETSVENHIGLLLNPGEGERVFYRYVIPRIFAPEKKGRNSSKCCIFAEDRGGVVKAVIPGKFKLYRPREITVTLRFPKILDKVLRDIAPAIISNKKDEGKMLEDSIKRKKGLIKKVIKE